MPVFDEVVISLARMKDVIDLNVEAGMYLYVINQPQEMEFLIDI